MRNNISIAALGAVLALLFAFYFQYIEKLHPCELCMWQRYGYVAVIFFFILYSLREFPLKKLMAVIISAALIVEVITAIYHTGIEQHWWEGFTSCSSSLGSGQSLEEIKARLAGTSLVRCDEATWHFVGLSMAAWNAIYAFGLFLISVIPCRKST